MLLKDIQNCSLDYSILYRCYDEWAWCLALTWYWCPPTEPEAVSSFPQLALNTLQVAARILGEPSGAAAGFGRCRGESIRLNDPPRLFEVP